MKPIESAEEFAREFRKSVHSEKTWSLDSLAGQVEARDNAVRLALLDEIYARDRGAMSPHSAATITMLRAKYSKPQP